VIGDQGMVKRDARTSPLKSLFLCYPSIAAQQANSPLGAQTRKSVFRPATSGMSRNADLPVVRQTGIPPFSSAIECERSLLWCRDQERLGIMRRVAIEQYRITASIAPQMSIITSRSEAVRDGTKA
jgi:hypothetical protein